MCYTAVIKGPPDTLRTLLSSLRFFRAPNWPLVLCATLRHHCLSFRVDSCSEYDKVRDVPRHCFSQVDNQNNRLGSLYSRDMQKSNKNRDTKSVYEETAPLYYYIHEILHDKRPMVAYCICYLILGVSQLVLFVHRISHVLAIPMHTSRCPPACSNSYSHCHRSLNQASRTYLFAYNLISC